MKVAGRDKPSAALGDGRGIRPVMDVSERTRISLRHFLDISVRIYAFFSRCGPEENQAALGYSNGIPGPYPHKTKRSIKAADVIRLIEDWRDDKYPLARLKVLTNAD